MVEGTFDHDHGLFETGRCLSTHHHLSPLQTPTISPSPRLPPEMLIGPRTRLRDSFEQNLGTEPGYQVIVPFTRTDTGYVQ